MYKQAEVCFCTLFSQESMENALNHLERQTDLLGQGLNNLREIIQFYRRGLKVEEEEDWDSEANSPPFYLPRQRTISFKKWAVRCPACGSCPSRCPCQ